MTYRRLQEHGTELTKKEVRRLRADLFRQYRKSLKSIQSELNEVYEKKLKGVDPEDYYNLMLKEGRLTELENKVSKLYLNSAKSANEDIVNASSVAISNEYYRDQYLSQWFAPIGAGEITPSFALIDPIAVEMSVFGTESRWKALEDEARQRDLDGYRIQGDRPTLRNLMLNNDRKALKRIKDTITQGLILGQSNAQMASSLRGSFGKIGRNADRIVRTETHRNISAGQYANQQNMKKQGVRTQRQILATLDTRTRAQSAQVDGRRDNKEGFFRYPNGNMVRYPGNSGIARWDISDRETTIEIIAGVSPKVRAGRNPNTGEIEIASFNSFSQWAKRHGIEKNIYGEIVKV